MARSGAGFALPRVVLMPLPGTADAAFILDQVALTPGVSLPWP
jgi:hypothetical protein